MSEDEEIERLREKKAKELKEKTSEESREEAANKRAEEQKKAILRKILEPEARERLNTLKMAKPNFAEQVEQQLIALAQSGRLEDRLGDKELKQLLKELQKSSSSDIEIKRR